MELVVRLKDAAGKKWARVDKKEQGVVPGMFKRRTPVADTPSASGGTELSQADDDVVEVAAEAGSAAELATEAEHANKRARTVGVDVQEDEGVGR